MSGELPFNGLRVLDLGTFWAGPFLGCYLGAYGADVIKVESIRRPDAFRYNTAFPEQGADWYERSGLFQATNLNKRGLTLDLTEPEGRDLLLRLLTTTDVMIENFSPRVVEQFGLGYDQVREVNPQLIMVRMPGFGTNGPWRDFVGFGNTFEHVGGLTAATGYPDRPPVGPGGYADPTVAFHGLVAVQAALEYRDNGGTGQLIELAQTEVVAAIAADQVMTFSTTGRVPRRLGNRSTDLAPQGVYPCRGTDAWLALSIRDDEEWKRLVELMADAELAGDSDLETVAGRTANHDRIDQVVAAWTASRNPDETELQLRAIGIPAAVLLTPARMYDDPHLGAVGYYQTVDHPVSGQRRYPGWASRYSVGPPSHHRLAAPTLGQHNDEILRDELGLTEEQMSRLRERGVIGERIPT